MSKSILYYFIIFMISSACNNSTADPSVTTPTLTQNVDSSTTIAFKDTFQDIVSLSINKKKPFERTKIEANLQQKIATNQPLVVHIFVPLCDNEHQGIVPTTASLGNGFSLRSNLYWATTNGMKRYFKEKKQWELLQSIKNVYKDSVVLERVIFKRTYPNQATVYVVADAYRGDKMLATLNHFSRAMSNNYTKKITLPDSTRIDIHGGADLVVFNGHNGFLDFPEDTPTKFYNTTKSQKDMVAIACFANEYFEREALRAQAYPIVRAKSTLHPGAFVISAIIDDWAMLKPVEEMRLSAGKAYCEIHDCSIKTSKNLFYKGWRPENLQTDY
ncbi:MAG: hypothetical protein JKY03_09175 [Aureispira sp.]|nr:hypothetical protein [Aureispira sp.]